MASSSVVEHLTVNQIVVGSIPTSPAYAQMVELADTPDLGSGTARFGGSSPSLGTHGIIAQWLERPAHNR